jgi:hypothetical protein
MPKYHVTYYYLATGMEGRPDIEDYGYINADSPEQARDHAARSKHPSLSESDIQWCIGCLTAKEVP